jgi:hypothetical protein
MRTVRRGSRGFVVSRNLDAEVMRNMGVLDEDSHIHCDPYNDLGCNPVCPMYIPQMGNEKVCICMLTDPQRDTAREVCAPAVANLVQWVNNTMKKRRTYRKPGSRKGN